MSVENKTYMTQREISMKAEIYLDGFGPPNSPPSTARRTPRMKKQVSEVIKKSITEKAKAPAGVTYVSPLLCW